MNKYIVNNEPELKNVIELILKKDKGAFIDYSGYAGRLTLFPITVTSNIKIKIKS